MNTFPKQNYEKRENLSSNLILFVEMKCMGMFTDCYHLAFKRDCEWEILDDSYGDFFLKKRFKFLGFKLKIFSICMIKILKT